MTRPSFEEHLRGGVYGLLVGDALGVPYEFHPSDDIPATMRIEYEPPEFFLRSHPGVAPGTWSDDGAHALCLLASLLSCGRLDVEDLGRRIVNWHDWGYMAVGNTVFDVGRQTSRAIEALRTGAAAADAGPRGEMDNGNGSLMRVLPLALWHRGTPRELAWDAMLQSLVTHGHPRSQLCCALYCLWARLVLEEDHQPWIEAVRILTSMRLSKEHVLELDVVLKELEQSPGGTGYVVDCLRSAKAAQSASTYEGVVGDAIRLGNDTDTTAAVAGGIAGLRLGIQSIPRRWMDGLRGKEEVEPLLLELLRHRGVG